MSLLGFIVVWYLSLQVPFSSSLFHILCQKLKAELDDGNGGKTSMTWLFQCRAFTQILKPFYELIKSETITMRTASQKWGYIRIMAGTIFGGILGFYVMHRLETNYKEKMNERLRDYEAELKRKKDERLNELEESSRF